MDRNPSIYKPDPNLDDVLTKYVDFHYLKDSLGSLKEYSK